MKKILVAFCGAALVLASCGNGGSKQLSEAQQQNKAFGDSLAEAFGAYAGVSNANMFSKEYESLTPEQKAKFSKEEFLKGLKVILEADTSNMAYINGMYSAFSLVGFVSQANIMADVPIDAKVFYDAFEKAFNDTVVDDPSMYAAKFQILQQQLMTMAREKSERVIRESPENQENVEAGLKFIEQKLGEGYSKTESGLVYKINEQGTGEKVKATDSVKIKYVGKHINGETFDESGKTPRTMRVSQVVPGFAEGLQLLSKGGSATLVIPGDLAYGLNGSSGVIGPNETLIFEVTVEDITTK